MDSWRLSESGREALIMGKKLGKGLEQLSTFYRSTSRQKLKHCQSKILLNK